MNLVLNSWLNYYWKSLSLRHNMSIPPIVLQNNKSRIPQVKSWDLFVAVLSLLSVIEPNTTDKAVQIVKTIKTVITTGKRTIDIGTLYMACGPIIKSIIDIINAVIKLIEAEIMPIMVKILDAVFIVVSLKNYMYYKYII